MHHPAIVPTTWPNKKTSNFDWNHFIFRSSAYNELWSEIKILTVDQKRKIIANDRAVDMAFIKYPNWGYLDNKRADNYVRKQERIMLSKGCIPVWEAITSRLDGILEIVVDAETEEDIQNRTFEMLEEYEFEGEQIFEGPFFKCYVYVDPSMHA